MLDSRALKHSRSSDVSAQSAESKEEFPVVFATPATTQKLDGWATGTSRITSVRSSWVRGELQLKDMIYSNGSLTERFLENIDKNIDQGKKSNHFNILRPLAAKSANGNMAVWFSNNFNQIAAVPVAGTSLLEALVAKYKDNFHTVIYTSNLCYYCILVTTMHRLVYNDLLSIFEPISPLNRTPVDSIRALTCLDGTTMLIDPRVVLVLRAKDRNYSITGGKTERVYDYPTDNGEHIIIYPVTMTSKGCSIECIKFMREVMVRTKYTHAIQHLCTRDYTQHYLLFSSAKEDMAAFISAGAATTIPMYNLFPVERHFFAAVFNLYRRIIYGKESGAKGIYLPYVSDGFDHYELNFKNKNVVLAAYLATRASMYVPTVLRDEIFSGLPPAMNEDEASKRSEVVTSTDRLTDAYLFANIGKISKSIIIGTPYGQTYFIGLFHNEPFDVRAYDRDVYDELKRYYPLLVAPVMDRIVPEFRGYKFDEPSLAIRACHQSPTSTALMLSGDAISGIVERPLLRTIRESTGNKEKNITDPNVFAMLRNIGYTIFVGSEVPTDVRKSLGVPRVIYMVNSYHKTNEKIATDNKLFKFNNKVIKNNPQLPHNAGVRMTSSATMKQTRGVVNFDRMFPNSAGNRSAPHWAITNEPPRSVNVNGVDVRLAQHKPVVFYKRGKHGKSII
jgi:hypothetical protein